MASPSVITERPLGNNDVGTVPSVTGLRLISEAGVGPVRQTVLYLDDVLVTLTDLGVVHAGGTKIYDFPEGLIQVLGATGALTFTASSATSANAVSSLGTVAANTNGTLTTTEADIVPSTATAVATSAGTFNAKSNAATMAAGVWDGTSTPVDVYLNAAGGADDVGGTRNYTGYITITWINHGDV